LAAAAAFCSVAASGPNAGAKPFAHEPRRRPRPLVNVKRFPVRLFRLLVSAAALYVRPLSCTSRFFQRPRHRVLLLILLLLCVQTSRVPNIIIIEPKTRSNVYPPHIGTIIYVYAHNNQRSEGYSWGGGGLKARGKQAIAPI